MSKLILPEGYSSALSMGDTQRAIEVCKQSFARGLSEELNLRRISAPLFVLPESGLNDDLSGVERPVSFDIPHAKKHAEIVHSLAKWKRMALYRYGFEPGEGLYTDMNAIRRDEETDNLHSIYVDQWDWERVITADERCEEFLHDTVRRIVRAMSEADRALCHAFPALKRHIHGDVFFITADELERMYPDFTGKEREDAICREHGCVFIQGIGAPLSLSGKPHDSRAPDYDDWSLNGDILVWYEPLGRAVELSSMGIRVDPAALDRQLTAAGKDERRELEFHKMLLAGELPLTIGGGIGQSRLSLVMTGKVHIGEVQCSVWPDEMYKVCGENNIFLL